MQTAGKYEEITNTTNTFLASKHILASSTWAQKWPYDSVIQIEHLVFRI